MRAAPVVALGFVLAGLSYAAATHSDSPCEDVVTPIDARASLFYLVHDLATDSYWIYQESNGHEGVQRGADPIWGFGMDHEPDPCWDLELATGSPVESVDFLVF